MMPHAEAGFRDLHKLQKPAPPGLNLRAFPN
jgi:hypothetical protein